MGKIKVLLVQDVEKLGKAGEVKQVAGGFGRNYLLPKGYAVLATPGQVRQAQERIQAQQRRALAARRDAEAVAARIQGITLTFVVRTHDQGRLFGSVTSMDIAEKLAEQTGLDIDRRKIDLDDPIKRTGIYPISLKLATGLEPVFNVVVESAEPEPVAASESVESKESTDTSPDE